MSISNTLLMFLYLLLYHVLAREINCNHSEPSASYLDTAMDMIAKAKSAFPVCPPPLLPVKIESKPMDCADVLNNGHNESGVYVVWLKSRVTEDKSLNVFCDMDTDGGGWTVIQRRGNFNRSKHFFYKDWSNYKNGFGDVQKDFWLGNDNIFALTNQRLYSIRFDLKAVDGEERCALYDMFWIDDEINNYTLHIKDYSGTAGDSINYKHDNQKFSTKDRDNDNHKNSCANVYRGGWWYNACHDSNLNGLYHRGSHESLADGVNWKSFRGLKESLDTTEMKIRPKRFRKN